MMTRISKSKRNDYGRKKALWIRDILVQIRIPGSVLVTDGSGCGSGRPENIRILRIKIRIHNTGRNKAITMCADSRLGIDFPALLVGT